MDALREKFSKVYDQYIEKIYRFVYMKVNSREAAEDIVSKVFIKGWETCQKRQDIKNMGAFLYQISRNAVVDHYRENGKAKMVSMDRIREVADKEKGLHDQAVLSQDMQMVKSAIGRLKKDYQDVLILHYLEDMPHAQIAQIMQRPEGTVRVMLHRGLKSLREEINKTA